MDRHSVDADPDQNLNFHVDADPDPDPDWHKKNDPHADAKSFTHVQMEKKKLLITRPQKGRPSYKRSLQPSIGNIQH